MTLWPTELNDQSSKKFCQCQTAPENENKTHKMQIDAEKWVNDQFVACLNDQ